MRIFTHNVPHFVLLKRTVWWGDSVQRDISARQSAQPTQAVFCPTVSAVWRLLCPPNDDFGCAVSSAIQADPGRHVTDPAQRGRHVSAARPDTGRVAARARGSVRGKRGNQGRQEDSRGGGEKSRSREIAGAVPKVPISVTSTRRPARRHRLRTPAFPAPSSCSPPRCARRFTSTGPARKRRCARTPGGPAGSPSPAATPAAPRALERKAHSMPLCPA